MLKIKPLCFSTESLSLFVCLSQMQSSQGHLVEKAQAKVVGLETALTGVRQELRDVTQRAEGLVQQLGSVEDAVKVGALLGLLDGFANLSVSSAEILLA